MEEERITDELAEQVCRDAGPADSPRRPDWLAERLDADGQLSEDATPIDGRAEHIEGECPDVAVFHRERALWHYTDSARPPDKFSADDRACCNTPDRPCNAPPPAESAGGGRAVQAGRGQEQQQERAAR